MARSQEALAVLELQSIARGYTVLDVIAKKAPISTKIARAVTPGKFAIVFTGGVAEVEESFQAGLEQAGSSLLDSLILPQAHHALPPALSGNFASQKHESLGIIETATICSTLQAADASLKTAPVSLINMELALGIGGKGFFLINGELADVEASCEDAERAIASEHLVAKELITRACPDVKGFFSK